MFLFKKKKKMTQNNDNNPLLKITLIREIFKYCCQSPFKPLRLMCVTAAWEEACVYYNAASTVWANLWNNAAEKYANRGNYLSRGRTSRGASPPFECGLVLNSFELILHRALASWTFSSHPSDETSVKKMEDEESTNYLKRRRFLWIFQKMKEAGIKYGMEREKVNFDSYKDDDMLPHTFFINVAPLLTQAISFNSFEILDLILSRFHEQEKEIEKQVKKLLVSKDGSEIFDIDILDASKLPEGKEMGDFLQEKNIDFYDGYKARSLAKYLTFSVAQTATNIRHRFGERETRGIPAEFFRRTSGTVSDEMSFVGLAVEQYSSESLQLLLQYGFDPNTHPSNFHFFALFLALSRYRTPERRQQQQEQSSNNNRQNYLQQKNDEIIHLLMESPLVNKHLRWSNLTCVYPACATGNLEMLKILVEKHKVEINCKEKTSGLFPLYVAVSGSGASDEETAANNNSNLVSQSENPFLRLGDLDFGCQNVELVKYLVERPDIELNLMTSSNVGVLHAAASIAMPKSFIILSPERQSQKEIDAAEQHRKEVYDKVIHRQIKVLNYLLFGNAKSKARLNINSPMPETPLFWVIRNNGDSFFAMVKWLVEVAGAQHKSTATVNFSGSTMRVKYSSLGELARLLKQNQIAKYLGEENSIFSGMKDAFASLVA